ncbi:MAG: pseudouridine synthase, partial [Alphaproteobacteria bacterium]|nr:pseudouridine synthase [Alphaproteobacteria bacterium]
MCARATGAFSRRSWRRAVAGERLAKRIARAGVCSRREAEKLIAAGCVTVDGKVVDTAAYNVTPQQDVRVDGQKLAAPEAPRLWLYHKPRGL